MNGNLVFANTAAGCEGPNEDAHRQPTTPWVGSVDHGSHRRRLCSEAEPGTAA